MAEKRNRYTEDGRPKPCVVRIPAHLAQFLYRGVREGNFQDETALVTEIIRRWSENQQPMNWRHLLGQLQEDEEEAELTEAQRIIMTQGPGGFELTTEEAERVFVRAKNPESGEPGEYIGFKSSKLREVLRDRGRAAFAATPKVPPPEGGQDSQPPAT